MPPTAMAITNMLISSNNKIEDSANTLSPSILSSSNSNTNYHYRWKKIDQQPSIHSESSSTFGQRLMLINKNNDNNNVLFNVEADLMCFYARWFFFQKF